MREVEVEITSMSIPHGEFRYYGCYLDINFWIVLCWTDTFLLFGWIQPSV